MVIQIPETLDEEAKRLRIMIFGDILDSKWNNIKEHWVKDILWLRAELKLQNKSPQFSQKQSSQKNGKFEQN